MRAEPVRRAVFLHASRKIGLSDIVLRLLPVEPESGKRLPGPRRTYCTSLIALGKKTQSINLSLPPVISADLHFDRASMMTLMRSVDTQGDEKVSRYM